MIEVVAGGLEPGEDPVGNVHPVVLSESEVEDGIRSGTIFDSKTLSAWLCRKLAWQQDGENGESPEQRGVSRGVYSIDKRKGIAV